MSLLRSLKCFLVLLLLLPISLHSQSKEEIVKHLESTTKFHYQTVTNGAFNEIFDLELIEVRLETELNQDEYGGISISRYFVKQGNMMKTIPSPFEVIELPELNKIIKSSYKLKTPEDGLILQTALSVITQEERNEGFFNKGNKWYFIRSDFFRSYFVVETDNNGKIKSIVHTKGIETQIPNDVQFYGEVKSYPDFEIPEISEKEKLQLNSKMKENFNYRFEVEDSWSKYFPKLSAGKYYEVKFIVSEQQGDEKYESSYFSNLLAYNGQIASYHNIWETALFIESTKPIFQLKTDADAKLFQEFLNEIEAKIEDVRFEKKEDLWFFVRDKSFGEDAGIIAKTDEKGNITRLSYSGFEDSDILRFRMQDSNFEVDFGFVLKSPENTTFRYNKDELDEMIGNHNQHTQIDVSIEFNEVAVNAIGAWVMTRHNGQDVGMYASTNMTSPFSSYIPVSEFAKGTHTVEFLLLRPGEYDPNPLGKVVFEIIID